MLAGGASMLNLLLDWILSAVAIFLVAYVVPGFEISGFAAALLAALVVGLVNATLGLVLKILTFPITIVTLGIFWIVINALMLMLAASFVPGFSIQGFLPAFIGAIVLSLLNLVLRKIKRELREERE